MRPRRRELRISDLATDRRRYVGVRVAAEYLEVDERTLRKYIALDLLAAVPFPGGQRIELAELRAFEARQRTRRAG